MAESKTLPLFAHHAAYLVAPGADPDRLLGDAGAFLDSARDVLHVIGASLDSVDGEAAFDPRTIVNVLWGASMLLQLSNGATRAAHTMGLRAKGGRHG